MTENDGLESCFLRDLFPPILIDNDKHYLLNISVGTYTHHISSKSPPHHVLVTEK